MSEETKKPITKSALDELIAAAEAWVADLKQMAVTYDSSNPPTPPPPPPVG